QKRTMGDSLEIYIDSVIDRLLEEQCSMIKLTFHKACEEDPSKKRTSVNSFRL
ncbi:25567_t:CDS:2, partial [Gigaspora rosea]